MKLPIERDWLYIYWKARKADVSCSILVDRLKRSEGIEYVNLEDFTLFLELIDDEFSPSVLEWYLLDKYGQQFLFQFYLLFINNEDFKQLKSDILRTKQIIQTTTENWESSEEKGTNDWKKKKTTSEKERQILVKDPRESTIDLWKTIRKIFKRSK